MKPKNADELRKHLRAAVESDHPEYDLENMEHGFIVIAVVECEDAYRSSCYQLAKKNEGDFSHQTAVFQLIDMTHDAIKPLMEEVAERVVVMRKAFDFVERVLFGTTKH